jgi:glycosyltransferase involved in cell wall biosynthesis
VRLPGRLRDDELVALYRRAWLLASASVAEGWGMTITEAAACATPAVVTAIAGHRDAVVDGVTGLLALPGELGHALARALTDADLRARLGAAALERAATFTWEATAAGTLSALALARARAAPGRRHRSPAS